MRRAWWERPILTSWLAATAQGVEESPSQELSENHGDVALSDVGMAQYLHSVVLSFVTVASLKLISNNTFVNSKNMANSVPVFNHLMQVVSCRQAAQRLVLITCVL